MRATVVADELYRALRQVKKCAAPEPGFSTSGRTRRRARIPILTHVRIEVSGDELLLTCTDLRVADVARLRTRDGADGAFCVPVRLFTNIISRLRDVGEPVSLAVRPGRVAAWGSDDDFAQDRDLPSVLVIECGAARFRLVGLPVGDFPLIDSLRRPSGSESKGESIHDPDNGVTVAVVGISDSGAG